MNSKKKAKKEFNISLHKDIINYIIYICFIIIVLILLICLSVKNENYKKSYYRPVEIKNTIEADDICQSDVLFFNDNYYALLRKCLDNKVMIEFYDDNSDISDMHKNKFLDIDNVNKYVIEHNSLEEIKYKIYILTNDGKIYTTNSELLSKKQLEVTQLKYKGIVDLVSYTVYKNNIAYKTNKVFAINKTGSVIDLD